MRATNILISILLIPIFIWAQQSPEIAFGDQEYITGVVYSDPGNGNTPLPGVQIEDLKSGERVFTGEDGSYKIKWNGEASWLRFEYPGFSVKERRVLAPQELFIRLYPKKEKTTDQEVEGPFGQSRGYKSSSYSSITGSELSKVPAVSFENALPGRMAGLTVRKISGMPGEGGLMNIRGLNSLFAPEQALVILDGVPIRTNLLESHIIQGATYNPLSSIDISDIENIELYKDGSSSYGVLGNSGVIMVSTRQPAVVNTKIDFSVYTGMTFEPEFQPLLSGTGYKTYMLNLLQSSGIPLSEIQQQNPWISGNPSYYYYYDYANDTDWQDEVMDPASVSKYNVSLQGGDEIARFSVSLGYLDQKGVLKNTDFQRYNFRLNASLQILQKLSMVANVGYSYQDASMMNYGTDPSLNPISSALLKAPMLAPYLRDNLGNQISLLSDVDPYGFSNPVALVEKTESGRFGSDLFASSKLIYNLTSDLDISTLVNVNFNNLKETVFIPDYGIADFQQGAVRNFAREGITKIGGFVSETRLDYSKQINYTHFLNARAGFRANTSSINYNEGNVYNTPTDEFKSLSSVSSIENTLIFGSNRQENRSDLFVHGDYRFTDRFLASVVLDFSGTSNVGPEADAISFLGGQWGFFPGIHLGWLISSEKFLRNSNALDLLKLRTSLSWAGNDFYSGFSRYAYVSRPYGTNSGIVRNYVPNPRLKWETVRQMNIGLDAAFFKERLQFSLDLFDRQTSDLLTYVQLPAVAGFDYYWENKGTLATKGMDVHMMARLLHTKKWKITAGVNAGYNVSSLNLPENLIIDIEGGQVILADGETPFGYYGLQTDGVFSDDSEAEISGLSNSNGQPFQAGDIRFVDQNNDKIINQDDRVNLGSILPNITGGAYLDFSFGGISLHVLTDFVSGNKLFNYQRMQSESLSGFANQSNAALYSWKSQGSTAEIPSASFGDPAGNSVFSDRWIEDGSFFRLKEVTLSYGLPETSLYKNVTLYATGLNLFTYTQYLGYSPEFAFSMNPALWGSDYMKLPVSPSAVLGIKIEF